MKVLILERIGDRVFVYNEDIADYTHNLHEGVHDVSNRLGDAFELMNKECDIISALGDGQWASSFFENRE